MLSNKSYLKSFATKLHLKSHILMHVKHPNGPIGGNSASVGHSSLETGLKYHYPAHPKCLMLKCMRSTTTLTLIDFGRQSTTEQTIFKSLANDIGKAIAPDIIHTSPNHSYEQYDGRGLSCFMHVVRWSSSRTRRRVPHGRNFHAEFTRRHFHTGQ